MSERVVPKRVYYTIFGILMLCTYLTVQIAFFDLGVFNIVAALAIAVFKATLVVLFFMHVKYGSRLTKLIVGAAFFFLGILLSLTMADYLSRGWFTAHTTKALVTDSPVYASRMSDRVTPLSAE